MPAYEVKSSWANKVEDERSLRLPRLSVVYENDFKIVTEYTLNYDNKRIKEVIQYEIKSCRVSKAIVKPNKAPDDKKPRRPNRGKKRGDSKKLQRRDDTAAIKISNLSEITTNEDLKILVERYGVIRKLYLAKEKETNVCKGFAYVHYKSRAEAARAIQGLHGCGYDYMILRVNWSRPPAETNQ